MARRYSWFCNLRKNSSDPLPEMPEEDSITDREPAHVQIAPYDVILAPGEQQKFQIRVFNERGQLLEHTTQGIEPASDGPGDIVDVSIRDFTYQAPDEKEHQAALITCKVGDVTGTARLRIVPPLPWKFDFNDVDDVPLTWIGGRVRYEVREVPDNNDEQMIVKKSVLPTPRNPNNKLGTRSQMFMGPIDLEDYTIQADVQLVDNNGKLSDVGLINSRYYMTLRGQTGELRTDSWPPHDFRTHESIDFDFEPGEWYTMKLTVVPDGDTTTVCGKLWKRGEVEPDDWTIEMVDHAPNLHGSPGLYGHASDAEIYIDNLTVTPN